MAAHLFEAVELSEHGSARQDGRSIWQRRKGAERSQASFVHKSFACCELNHSIGVRTAREQSQCRGDPECDLAKEPCEWRIHEDQRRDARMRLADLRLIRDGGHPTSSTRQGRIWNKAKLVTSSTAEGNS